MDGEALRNYRHAPNAGSCKSWAAGGTTSTEVRLTDTTMRGEMGSTSVLMAPQWGFYDVLFIYDNKNLAIKPEKVRKFNLQRD